MSTTEYTGTPIKLTLSGAVKIGTVEGTVYPKEAREFLMEKKQSDNWLIYPITKPISGKNGDPYQMIGNCDRAFNSMTILIWEPEDIVEYFVMDRDSSKQHALEDMFGLDVDGDMLYILHSNAVDDL